MMPPIASSCNVILGAAALEQGSGGNAPALLAGLCRLAGEASIPLYLVGGPVRDRLLGLPVKDLDFAVEGDAPGLARRLALQAGGRLLVHPRFGTATVTVGETRIDLVTARRETYPSPGALPVVSAGVIADDLARRDFTINALALSMNDEQPRLIDPHGGQRDLAAGSIRTLHAGSFRDDPTRIFRAVRYEQRLSFALEPQTMQQLRAALDQGCVKTLSGVRLTRELERMFNEAQPGRALLRAAELGALTAIHPALAERECLLQWSANVHLVCPPEWAAPLTWLAALSFPLSPAEGERIIARLQLPNSRAQVVRAAIRLRGLERKLGCPSLSPSRLCEVLEGVNLAALYAAAGLFRLAAARRAATRYLQEWRGLTPALRGDALLSLGVPAGPPLGAMLAQLRRAALDGQVANAAEEREWVLRRLSAGFP